jgi:hypothetical protein
MNDFEGVNTDLNLHQNHMFVFADVAFVNVPGL